MSCFKFPMKTCKEFDKMLSKFWWGKGIEGDGIHWKAWDTMTKQKKEGGMGFREFADFNLALLAKSAWRLIQNPNVFWVRLLKGIYYPNSDFMKARKGGKASWGWASILEGRDMIKSDLTWKIGDGRKVNVWRDKWVGEVVLSSTNPLSSAVPDLVVADLIQHGEWNEEIIKNLFDGDTGRKIKQIPISCAERNDALIWKGSWNGEYSVRKGYALFKERRKHKISVRPSTSYCTPTALWGELWKLRVPPKIQHFLWRAVNGCIATSEALFRRKCCKDPVCQLCGRAEETIEHCLLLCEWSRMIWFGSDLNLLIDPKHISRFDEWLWKLVGGRSRLNEFQKAMVASICWCIWKNRCKVLFQEGVADSLRTLQSAVTLIEDLWVAKGWMKEAEIRCKSEKEKCWRVPEPGVIKVNIDGSYISHTGKAGIGVIFRDQNGRILSGFSGAVVATSALMAEALAARKAAEMVKQVSGGCYVIESDNETLYGALVNENIRCCEWKSQVIVEDTLAILSSKSAVSFSVVPRALNKAADWLAANGSKGVSLDDWVNWPPPPLAKILENDLVQRQEGLTRVKGNEREGIG